MDPRLRAAELAKRAGRPIDEAALDALLEGRASLREALNLDTTEIQLLRTQGLTMLEAGRPDDAIAIFAALIALDDEDPGVRFLLANAYRMKGDLGAAVVHFQRGLETSNAPHMAGLRESALSWGRHLVAAVAER